VLLAAREELRPSEAVRPLVPWPESVAAARVGDVHVVSAHVPNAANGWIKPQTLRALHEALAAAPDTLRILCGDLNTPRRESTEGEVWTFAQDARGRLRPERGEEWDSAERDVLCALPGMVDVFRAVNGYVPRDLSWTWRRWRGGYRLDHVLASGELDPVTCAYHHDWRNGGLSDHSPIEAEFAG
jgi:endonuclease/exonuclease/phosphatase family metal-dependent hydrolase